MMPHVPKIHADKEKRAKVCQMKRCGAACYRPISTHVQASGSSGVSPNWRVAGRHRCWTQ